MTRDGGARPAHNRPATDITVSEEAAHRRAAWRERERARNRLAMDRYIADTYGTEWVTRSRG